MKWTYKKLENFPINFHEAIGGHPLVASTIWQLGLCTPGEAKQFIYPEYYKPSSPFDFQQMCQAIEITQTAIKENLPILVWGDFDVDGQTATALLVSAMEKIGANVSYHIPIRGPETHGIDTSILNRYISQGIKLLITCDTGITANTALQHAKDAGVKVIITDHHQLGFSLPVVDAIINPVLLPSTHPAASLPGVGVAYKYIKALNEVFENKLKIEDYLDLVALGIVADVALLRKDTRYLLQKGMDALQKSERIGLQAIFQKADLVQNQVNSQVIGFQIAPRLNAIGRLADANKVVELLLTHDQTRAEIIATEIEGSNIQRRMLGKQIYDSAQAILMASPDLRHDPTIIIHNPNWPAGVVGTVAGRLAQKYNKPTFILTGTEDMCKGSARSVEGINIIDAIAAHAQLLGNFGGHPMAAGLSMPLENLPQFQAGMNAYIQKHYAGIDLTPTLEISWELSLPDISLDLIFDIERLAPFGKGNPQPVFVSHNLSILSISDIGREADHRKLTIQDENGNTHEVLWWNSADEELPQGKIDLAYHLSTNSYKGQEQISLEWVDAKVVEPIVLESTKYHLFDFRYAATPLNNLADFVSQFPEAILWAETSIPTGYQAVNRDSLKKATELILWELPSSNQLLQEILKKVEPHIIAVFSQGSAYPNIGFLIKSIVALLKSVLSNQEGNLIILDLEMRLGIPNEMMQNALAWLQEFGAFQFTKITNHRLKVNLGKNQKSAKFSDASRNLQRNWDEYLNYLEFLRTTPLEKVIS